MTAIAIHLYLSRLTFPGFGFALAVESIVARALDNLDNALDSNALDNL